MMKKLIRLLLISGFLPLHFFSIAQNVGIGTLTPSSKLQIIGSADTTQLIIDANSTQSNTHPLIKLRSSTGADLMSIHSDNINNTFIGFETGKNNNAVGGGVYNTFIGSLAGAYNKTGYANTAIGSQALTADTSGYFNTANGYQALYFNSSGFANTAIGSHALFANTIGTGSMAAGASAGYNNSTGSYNTFIGTGADLASSTQRTNATAIGYNAKVNASNALVLGGTGADAVSVGIGISSPNYELHIHDDTNPARLQFTSPFTGTTSTDGFIVGHNSESGEGLIWNRENEDILFITNDIGRMKIKADGKVGIGTGSPNYDLHIHNSSFQSGLQFTSASTGTTDDDGFYVGHNNSSGEAMLFNFENLSMRFGTNGFERMRILADGKVGIGTPTPFYPLEATSAAVRTGNFINTAISLDNFGVFGTCTNTPFYGIGVGGSGGYIGVVGEALLTGAGDRYGVYGSASGGDGNNWAVYSNGSSYATGTWQTSDERFKKDIHPIENAGEKLKQLAPSTYNFKTEEYSYMGLPAEQQFGFVAQDFEKVFPELVRNIEQPIDHSSKEKGVIQFKGINYIELIPVTIAAFQEQQKTIEELKNQVEQLLLRIEDLEKK